MIVRGSETVLVQGITGTQATFWSERMREYGTKLVGGVNPKKAGTEHLGLPVWGSAADAAKEADIDVSCLIVPPLGVKSAALDAIEAGIKKLVILTEHVPVRDVMYFLAAAREGGRTGDWPEHRGHRHHGRMLCRFHAGLQRAHLPPGISGRDLPLG